MLTGTLGQSEPGVMTKGYSTLTKSPELEPLYNMQFSVIARPSFLEGLSSLCRGYCQCILI